MEKMISPDGVKANMCCASCAHFTYKYVNKRWCIKKDSPIIDLGHKCGYYTMAKFFQKRNYKPL